MSKYIAARYVVAGGLIISCLTLCGTMVFAQSTAHLSPQTVSYHTPKLGSAERKAIMDALRIPVEKDLGIKVIFVVPQSEESSFRVVRDWAFVSVEFHHPDGKPMGADYYKDAERSDDVQALLHRVHGKWRVVAHVTGPTDVEWEDWPAKYHAPANVVPH